VDSVRGARTAYRRTRVIRLPPCSTLPHHHEWRPEGWVRLVRFAFVDESQHRAPQGLCSADLWIAGHLADGGRDESE